MYSQRRMVWHSFRLGMLVTLLFLVLSACGGNEQQESKPRPLPEERKALRPGEYHSEEFKPSLTFRVSKGWTTSPPEVFDALPRRSSPRGYYASHLCR